MKHRVLLVLAVLTAALGLLAAGIAAPSAEAKSCGSGYVHASLSWGHKCLRAGQYCTRSGDREYHRYRFHCHGTRLTGRP